MTGSNSFRSFYSPACFAINQENTYCPVSFDPHDPFSLKLDITKLVKNGLNTVKFVNTAQTNPKFQPNVVIEYPRVVIE